jgi:hypothetical protein
MVLALVMLGGVAASLIAGLIAGLVAREPEPVEDPVALYLRFVRNAGEKRLADLPDMELLRLGMATSDAMCNFGGDVDMTILAAVSSGASFDTVLPIVVGVGFFLRPEYSENVHRALLDGALFR